MTRTTTLAIALCACTLASACRNNGEQQTANAQPAPNIVETPAFNAQAALEMIRTQVEFGPRVPGTPGHAKQLAWMQEYIAQRADTSYTQTFEHTTKDGRSLQLSNIFARFKPNARDRVLLLAHWDTRPTADQENDPAARTKPIPGANDGGSGVAFLLQLADVFKKTPPPIGVDILLVDGEDFTDDMYLGSEHFAANLPPAYSPLYGVLVDMIADEDPKYPIESYSQQYAPEVVDRVWRTAEQLGYSDYFPRLEGGAISDDHIPLNKAGIRTIDIIDFDYGPGNSYWHTANDSFEHTSAKGLDILARVLLQLIYRGG